MGIHCTWCVCVCAWRGSPHKRQLTHWGRVTHICVSKLPILGSDNGLSLIRRQAIIWTNAGILLIRTLGTNFSEIFIQIHSFWNKNMHLKMSSGKCRPFYLGLNVLMGYWSAYRRDPWSSWSPAMSLVHRINCKWQNHVGQDFPLIAIFRLTPNEFPSFV